MSDQDKDDLGRSDLEASVRGAALQGVLSPALIRAFVRKGKGRGLTEKDVLRIVARIQDEVGTPAPPVPDPQNAEEEIRDIVRGALLQDILGPAIRQRVQRRGRSLGLSAERVDAIITAEVQRHMPVPLDHHGEEVSLDESGVDAAQGGEDVADTPSLDLLRRRTGIWLPPEARGTEASPGDDFLPVTAEDEVLDDGVAGLLPPPVPAAEPPLVAALPEPPRSAPRHGQEGAPTVARVVPAARAATVVAAQPTPAASLPPLGVWGGARRLVRHAALSATAVLAGVALGFGAFAFGHDPEASTLAIELNVPAAVSINGKAIGVGWKLGPFEDLPVAENLVLSVNARGYGPIVRQVTLRPGENRVLELRLAPLQIDRTKHDVSLPSEPAGSGVAQIEAPKTQTR